MKTPMSYFKFVSFDRKQILESGLIRFTPAAEFNDPFELNPTITPISRKFIECQSNLENSDLVEPHFNEEDYKYSCERESLMEAYRAKFNREMAKYGVLSLCSNNNVNYLLTVSFQKKEDPRTNLLMWSHYADSHKGFVIEFGSRFIDGANIEKVSYGEDRHQLTFEDIDENNFDSIFFRKSTEWSYEQEYRVVLPLDQAHDTSKGNIHLFKIKKCEIRSVTFGSRMPEDNKKKIIDIIKGDGEYKAVQFNHAFLHDDGYMLDFYDDDGRWSNNPAFSGKTIPLQKKI